MAFVASKLSALMSANGFTLWHYDGQADVNNTIDTVGYFNAAAGYVRVNDVMIIRGNAGATVGLAFVNANDGTVVDLADILPITATDTR